MMQCSLQACTGLGLTVSVHTLRESRGVGFNIHNSYSYILQANEQNIKISIKQTQTQPQYSVPHGRRRVVTPLTRDQK